MKHQKNSDPDIERETTLLNVIAGDSPDTYLVLANWVELPVEPEEIHGCIVSIRSLADMYEWQTVYSLDTWILALRQLTPEWLLIGTADDYLIRITKRQIETIQIGIGRSVGDIWVINEHNCWLAHDEGLAYWDGQNVFQNRPSARIHKIHGLASDFAIAVGAEGLVLIFDGKTWREVDSAPTNQRLIGAFCVDQNQIFISGWRGTLYKWDGKDQWQKIKFTGDIDPREINAGGIVAYLGDVYVCASECGLYKIQGKKAVQVQSFYAGRAAVIHNKLIVTGGNLFVEFDGTDWSQVEINLPD
jgi:hypothetical protein